jgi:hypothetical protein
MKSVNTATEEDVSSATTKEKSLSLGEDKYQARFLAYLRDLYTQVPDRRRKKDGRSDT